MASTSSTNENWSLVPQMTEEEFEKNIFRNTWVLTKCPDMKREWRKQDSLFFTLPAELRHRIYSDLLHAKKLWDIRHDPSCRYSDSNGRCDQIPWKTRSKCKCIRSHRTCLSLLLVCRQMNYEATPLYYRQNVVCFNQALSGWERELERLGEMRPSILLNVRRMSILTTGTDILFPDQWEVVLNCTALEILELHHENLGGDRAPEILNQLCALPCFHTLRVVSLLDMVSWGYEFVVRLASEVPLPMEKDDLSMFHDRFVAYELQVREAAEDQLADFKEICRRSRKRDPPTKFKLEVDEGTTQWVRVYGAPNTSRTSQQMRSSERKENEEIREVEKLAKLREAKKTEKERRDMLAWRAQLIDDYTKTTERQERRERLKEEEKKDDVKAKRKLRRRIRKQEQSRLQERKRGN